MARPRDPGRRPVARRRSMARRSRNSPACTGTARLARRVLWGPGMTTRTTFLAAVALGALTAGRAHAGTRVGIEMGASLVGYRGIGARVDLGPFQLEGLIDGQLIGSTDAPRRVDGTARALVPIRRWRDGWIGVAAGVDGMFIDDAVGSHFWALEGSLHAEWFPLPALSLGLDLGACFGGGGTGAAAVEGLVPQSYTFADLGAASLAGGGTVTFWF
jgi:hypothetical protein